MPSHGHVDTWAGAVVWLDGSSTAVILARADNHSF